VFRTLSNIKSYTFVAIERRAACHAVGSMYLSCNFAGRKHRASAQVATVDEQNGLAGENRRATKWWWAIHIHLPKGAQLSGLSSPRGAEVK